MEFEYLEHTADVKFKAYGKTLEEAFRNALRASMNVMVDIQKVEGKIEKNISIESRKPESLLYDFIEELLFLFDTEGFIACDAKDIEITEDEKFHIKAVLLGDPAEDHELHGDVKAVTYNDMEIKKDEGYEIQVVLDI